MKRLIVLALALAVVIGVPFHSQAEGEEVTLKGEAVDIPCYTSGKRGKGHATCAKGCVEIGNPIGLAVKTDDGEDLYLILIAGHRPAKEMFGEHMGQQVEVTGEVEEAGGMKMVTVSSVKR